VVSAPPSATAGTSFDVTIRALDAYGHTASGYSGTVTFTSSDTAAGVVLPADYSFTDSDAGVHTFSGTVLLITPGDQTLTVTDTVRGISGSATVTVVPGPVPPPGSAAGGESSSQAAAVADQLFGSDHALMLARRKRDASGDDLFHEITQVDRGELVALEVGRRGLAGLFGK